MMKQIPFLLLILILSGCEEYSQESDPVIFMGGGKWTFVDYDLVVINSITPLTILKNDTICINSFYEASEIKEGIVMKQDYNNTAISRRFIRNRTQWEFEGYKLYCEWMNASGGMKPSHNDLWVSYPNPFYTNATRMSVFDSEVGTTTNYTFQTNNKGVAPPNELILMSPEIVINLYSSSGARDKAVTIKVILAFIRL